MSRAREKPREVSRPLWPGAVERGLQVMPERSPLTLDLTDPVHQCWMNIMAGEHQKGAPLTAAELRRILRGGDWRPLWRRRADLAAGR